MQYLQSILSKKTKPSAIVLMKMSFSPLSQLRTTNKPFVFLFFLGLFVASCEKDDICNEGTPGTPRVVIRFYDQNNPSQFKSVSGFAFKEINQEKAYRLLSGDSTALPMDLSKAYTRYAVIISSNDSITIADTLQFNHGDRKDIYSRRACGFSAEYRLMDPPITVIGSPTWYIRSTILLDSIRNEDQAHLAIYH